MDNNNLITHNVLNLKNLQKIIKIKKIHFHTIKII